ncbi:hypothetical protein MCOR02_010659 [Pyricularia oryzae]|nr:hypothetical protein MCOR02_010659 [Pyricularia oryzae]
MCRGLFISKTKEPRNRLATKQENKIDTQKKKKKQLKEAWDKTHAPSKSMPQPSTVEPPAFSLLDLAEQDWEKLRAQAARACNVDQDAVTDIYPCTPLQEGLMSLASRDDGDYIMEGRMQLAPDLDVDKFRAAWEAIVEGLDVLRTRIVYDGKLGFLQVVIREKIKWITEETVQDYQKAVEDVSMDFGQPLVLYALVGGGDKNKRQFIWTVHHAVWDGYFLQRITESLISVYQEGAAPFKGRSYNIFIKSLMDQDRQLAKSQWASYFDGCNSVAFPQTSSPTENRTQQQQKGKPFAVHRLFYPEATPKRKRPISVIINAAFAVVVSHLTNTTDVVFGTVDAGRKRGSVAWTDMGGPTMDSVPVRITVEHNSKVGEFLDVVQQQHRQKSLFAQIGLQEIKRINGTTQKACDFGTLLVVQGRENYLVGREGVGEWLTGTTECMPRTYRLNLEAFLKEDHVKLVASTNDGVMGEEEAGRLLELLSSAMHQLAAADGDAQTTLAAIHLLSDADRRRLWEWNAEVPAAVDRCIHDLISDQAGARPEATAVVGPGDGEFTYGELDRLTKRLASHLVRLGVANETFVPLCFRKSCWAVVAMLAVLRAGGAFVPLDPAQAAERREDMIRQTGARLVLVSEGAVAAAATADRNHLDRVIVAVGPALMSDLAEEMGEPLQLAAPSPSSAAYVVFTSGSTGKPKGVVVNHGAASTSCQHHGRALGFCPESRVLQFASYAFDASIMEMLTTLVAGGCVCIVPDKDKLGDVEAAIDDTRANLAFLTPTVANMLDPARLGSLETIIMGGEAVTRSAVERWMHLQRVYNIYGPTECAIVCSGKRISRHDLDESGCIGKAMGSVFWVVSPRDQQRLCPIGAVGELLIEGPILARGYLGDAALTAASFIEDPPWLLGGGPGHPGRRGRLYKTGDLVRYNSDGSLTYVGRKDNQVKIRGQRVELGEVEHHLRACVPGVQQAAAEVIKPQGESASPMLAAFLVLEERDGEEAKDGADVVATIRVASIPPVVEDTLAEKLPAYMVPAVFFTVSQLPLNTSGKTDRRRLRELGSTFSYAELAELQSGSAAGDGKKRMPATDDERALQQIWARVLNLDPESIGADDSFFRLGGDSISAMKLVADARRAAGLTLSVADVFRNPRLTTLAAAAGISSPREDQAAPSADDVIKPFALLCSSPDDVSPCRARLAAACGLDAEDLVEDAYPCTPLQEGLLALATKSAGAYTFRSVLEIPKHVEVDRFRRAWETAVRRMPILRTRIVEHGDSGRLVQVVVDEPIRWTVATDLEQYIQKDASDPVGLGKPLSRYALVHNSGEAGPVSFVWTLHHALYDGWSMPLLLEQVQAAYFESSASPPPVPTAPFQAFIKYIATMDLQSTGRYWQAQLADCEAAPFPALPSPAYQPQAKRLLQHSITGFHWPQMDITQSTLLRAAWAIVVSRQTASSDVAFGVVSNGRQAPVPGIERMAGPTIATVPVRVKLRNGDLAVDLLHELQLQAAEMVPHEQFGLSSIGKLGPGAAQACRFQSLLVVQPKTTATTAAKGPMLFPQHQLDQELGSANDIGQFETYALTVLCQLGEQNVDVELRFDEAVVSPAMANLLVRQFDQVFRQLCQPELSDLAVDDVETTSKEDLRQIWAWNASVPETVEVCVHDLFAECVRRQPDAPAICAWDGELTYGELDAMSSRLAHHLARLGAGPGTIVPLCFEKSMWTSVAILGVMKAGAASVTMDTTQPAARLRLIVEQALSNSRRQLIVSSVENRALAGELVNQINEDVSVVVAADVVAKQDQGDHGSTPPPTSTGASPQDLLYVVFTSGSTGVPKGVMITHANFSSAVRHQHASLCINGQTRLLDFAPYTFDASWLNFLAPITLGGVSCVPSQDERMTNLSGAISRTAANFILVPPSAVRVLNDADLSRIQTVVLGGEMLAASDADWVKKAVNVINAYGPAECTIVSTIERVDTSCGNPGIGRGCGTVTWIARPDGKGLVSIGETGELWIEGPMVGQGYLGDAEKTAASFIQDPAWLVRGGPDSAGRHGRLYRTGDLVRYDADGVLHFAGRKDDQVKIRGQRVELGEIEYHLKECIAATHPDVGVVVEVVQPAESQTKMPVAILALGKAAGDGTALAQIMANIDAKLSDRLPAHMIPGAYVPTTSFPQTATGKMDRRALRNMVAAKTLQQLQDLNLARSPGDGSRTAPSTEAELQLQRLWAAVLGVSPESIVVEDNFLRIGGDSVAAMRLVGRARQQGLLLTVKDVFQSPRLRDQAIVMRPARPAYVAPPPFSLIPVVQTSPTPTIDRYLPGFPDQGATLVDLLPTTDFQNFYIRNAISMPLGMCYHFSFHLPSSVNPQRIVELCQLMWQQFDILRAVFIQNQNDDTFLQAILDGTSLDLSVHQDDDPDGFARRWCKEDFQILQLGKSFIRALLCHSSTGGGSRLVLRLSHAQYDGLALPQIVQLFASGLQGQTPPAQRVSFAGYTRQMETQRTSSLRYWQEYLKGSKVTQLPNIHANNIGSLSKHDQIPSFEAKEMMDPPKMDGTPASVFVATCALAISKVTGVRDVVFGLLVSGRSTLPDVLSDVVGPCINMIPIRVDTGAFATIYDMVAFIQNQMVSNMNSELCQFSDVKAAMGWDQSLDFGFEVHFQNIDENPGFSVNGERVELEAINLGPRNVLFGKQVVSILGIPKEESWELKITGRLCDKDLTVSLMDQMRVAISAEQKGCLP